MIDFFLKRSFVVNVIMIFVLALGVWGFVNIPRTVVPVVSMNAIRIDLVLPGASSVEVEKHVIFPVEQAIRSLGLPATKITSSSKMGTGEIELVFKADFDQFEEAINRISAAIDSLKKTLPKDLEVGRIAHPQLNEVGLATVFLRGVQQDNLQDRAWIKMIEEDLRKTAGVTSIWHDLKSLDVYIEFYPNLVAAAELSISDVREQIGKYIDFSQVGEIDGKKKIAVVVKTGVQDLEEIKHIPIVANRSGDIIYLQDIAKVEYRFPRKNTRFIASDHADVEFGIEAHPKTDSTKVYQSLLKRVDQIKAKLPPTMSLWIGEGGFAQMLPKQFGVLRDSGLQGLIIIALFLTFFFGHRFAGMMMVGLPVAYGAVLAMMYLLGISLSLMSLLGALLVVGILTDDTVIITEQYLHYLRQNLAPLDAIKKAIKTTMIPILGTVLTTFAVFLPMVLVKSDNILIDFYKSVPIIIIVALSFSFFETFFLLPSHLKYLKKEDQAQKSTIIIQKVERFYRWALNRLFKLRYLLVVLAVGFIVSAIIPCKKIDKFFRDIPLDSNNFTIDLELKQSTSLDDSEQQVASLANLLDKLVAQNRIKDYWIRLGRRNYRDDRSQNFGYGEIRITTRVHENENFVEVRANVEKQIEVWRDAHQQQLALFRFSDRGQYARSIYDESMQLYVSGGDQLDFDTIHQEVAVVLKNVPGISQLRLDQTNSQDEWQFIPDRVKMLRYKMDNKTLAAQLREYFTPQELRKVRMHGESLSIFTLFRGKQDFSYEDLAKVRILNAEGVAIRTTNLGTWKKQKTLAVIKHEDLFRRFTLNVDYQKDKYSREAIANNIRSSLKPLEKKYPAYNFSIDSYSQKEQENISWLQRVGVAAFGTMLVVLMLCLQSIFKPWYVLAVIPFAMSGALWMMYLAGIQLNFNSIIGLIGMTGVAINDAILMAATLKEGAGRHAWARKTLIDQARERLRPVMITTVTTLAGIFPLIYFGDINVTFYSRSMFFAFAWGIFTATVATLFLLPIFNLLLDDFKYFLKRIWAMLKNTFKGAAHTTGMFGVAIVLGGALMATSTVYAKAVHPTPTASPAKSLALPSYLQIALTKEEDPQIAQEAAEQAQLKALSAQSFFNLHGSLNPSYTKDHSSNTPSQKALQGKVKSELLSTGTTLEGGYTKSKGKIAEKRDQGEWTFKVAQSLGKNAFGRGQAAEGKALGAAAQAKAISAQQSKLQICTQAINDFYEAFSAQAKAAIYQETYNLIQKRVQQLKANYKQHYVSQITYLQGTADALDMKEKLNNHLKLAKTARSQLARLGVAADFVLADPRPLLEDVRPPAKFDFNQSYRGQVLAKGVDEAKFKQEQARYNTYPQLDLSLEFKKVDPQDNNSNVKKIVTLQLETDFTIFDRAVSEEKQVAALDASMAQRKLRQGEQDFQKKVVDTQQELQNQREALALEQQKTDLYRQATQEQLRRLRNAKIEFSDYLKQRDQYIESRVAQLDHFKAIIAAKLNLWLMSDQLPPICAGINP